MRDFSKKWSEAKKFILGGNMLLSKRPEMFVPKFWPTYFKKSKKIFVWDLNGRKYKDFIFAVGQSTLGYSNSKIDNKVKKFISLGNMTTLNCHEEVKLAKKLVKIHPWADMVKFARSGGEANALAIRIARSGCKPKKDNIAICGYHGWHDWYLSVNLNSKNNLDQHLLPGLDPIGVPKELKNKTHAFEYGNIDQLKKIHKKFKLGIIKMEVARNNFPDIKFLREVRSFCNREKIILIFDECTTGFRYNLGGLHLVTGVYPDISMFGKALGNGYAITAVIGKKSVMSKAVDSFISSTFWTERIGYVAALSTIEFMEAKKTYKSLDQNGRYIKKKWAEISKKHNVEIKINQMNCIANFMFGKNNNLLKSLVTKLMLEKGYLASNMIYLSIFHNKMEIDKYAKALDQVFKVIGKIQNNSNQIKNLLSNSEAKETFKRLIT